MSSDKDTANRSQPLEALEALEGYQPLKKDKTSKAGNLDVSNPPQGGSGFLSKGDHNNDADKKE